MRRTVVLDIAGLSANFLGDRTPHLTALARSGGTRLLKPVLPAVGPAVQATFTTGLLPRVHGCVGSAWYARDLGEVLVGRESSRLVEGERIWDVARKLDPSFTVATVFWSNAMYGSADWCVSPRSNFHTDPGCLRGELRQQLGEPFPREHSPSSSGLAMTRWIARCARHLYQTRLPSLTMVSLPHLDRALQRLGPDHPELGGELEAVDAIAGELIEHVTRDGARVIVLSTHAVVPVAGPVHINRALRQAQLLDVRREQGFEVLDPGASDAFAVADHQIAHVYVKRAEQVAGVKAALEVLPGVDAVLDREAMRAQGIDHARAGDLLAIAAADRWFTYYWWNDDALAPELARTVDPGRKPGVDPCELFLDPTAAFPRMRLAWKSLVAALGFRTAIDVVSLNANVVRGSYGRVTNDAAQCPTFITSDPDLAAAPVIDATEVKRLVLDHLFEGQRKVKRQADPSAHLQLLTPVAGAPNGAQATHGNGKSAVLE